MAQVVLSAVVLVLAATIVWQNERQYRERREIAEQIDGLLQRIQAPEHAVIARFNEQQPEDTVRAVNEFIDEDYWPTRDELADKAAEAEVNGSG